MPSSSSQTTSSSSTPSSASNPTPTLTENTKKSNMNLGATLGGVLGGLAFVILVALLVLRRRTRATIEEYGAGDSGKGYDAVGSGVISLKEYYANKTASAEFDRSKLSGEVGDSRANRHELEGFSR